jgi:hypothetical protein
MSDCTNPQENKNRMYQSLMDMLLQPANEAIDDPTGNWADFNCLYNTYEKIKYIADHGNGRSFFCPEDVPAEPQINDYPDLEEPKTIDCDQT